MNVLKKDTRLRGERKHRGFMITDERQLDIILEDPNKPLVVENDMGFSNERGPLYKVPDSLVDKVRKAKESGASFFEVSYDFFYGGSTRTLFPDSEKTIKAYKVIHDIVREHGLGFSASIINPLDIGGGYVRDHEEIGYHWQYQEGAIHTDGSYSVELELQDQWTNNKGPMHLELDRIVVYAFKEKQLGDSNYFYVNPEEILDISDTAVFCKGEEIVCTPRGYGHGELNIHGSWDERREGYSRCLCVAVYRTREMDYFAPGALDYMKSIIDKHARAGITYQGFYSDEMHIQYDWGLDAHYGLHEVPTRYLTPGLAREYAKRYGDEFADFGRYLVYFSYHQHDFITGEAGDMASQHVLGDTPEGIFRTWLLRKRYYDLLNEKVVDLCVKAKSYAEEVFGNPVVCHGHATWVESPALDRNYPQARYGGIRNPAYSRYDYHENFAFSSSIIEAMAGCYNYFNWNDYFTGGGTDHGEDGYSDRNYYTQAFAASLADLNKDGFGYSVAWGSPKEVVRRFDAVGKAYGTGPYNDDFADRIVQEVEGRITDVLAVYPLDLVYVEERFGSWMVQYGYCNYITEDKLLKYGSVNEKGLLQVKEKEYRALIFFFQPFVSERTLELTESFVHQGGKVLWMSMPPVLTLEGGKPEKWKNLFGIKETALACSGEKAFGGRISFADGLEMEDMEILSDLLPDQIYPFVPENTGKVIARLKDKPMAVIRSYEKGGCCVYAGFRVRDDQSGSTGKDVSTLFDLLTYMGAYAAEGGEILSRPCGRRYVINRFPNKAVSVANHYRTFCEEWDGLHSRDEKIDAGYLKGRTLPPVEIDFEGKNLFGHSVTYHGTDTLTYRVDEDGELLGFAGRNCRGIGIDGKEYVLSQVPARLCYAVLDGKYFNCTVEKAVAALSDQTGELTLPNPLGVEHVKAYYCEMGIFSDMHEMPVKAENDAIRLTVTDAQRGRFIIILSEPE